MGVAIVLWIWEQEGLRDVTMGLVGMTQCCVYACLTSMYCTGSDVGMAASFECALAT